MTGGVGLTGNIFLNQRKSYKLVDRMLVREIQAVHLSNGKQFKNMEKSVKKLI